jgi:hypothetical protein
VKSLLGAVGWSKGAGSSWLVSSVNRAVPREELHGHADASGKPFVISKWEVWEAYRQVKANKGAPGVDQCSLEDFEKDLKRNLYKI